MAVNDTSHVTLTIISDTKEDITRAKQLIGEARLDHFLTLSEMSFSRTDTLETDIALVIFSSADEETVGETIADTTSLKIIKNIPVVLALIVEASREAVSLQAGDLATDDAIFLPTSPEEFAKVVMTHVASLKIRTTGSFLKSDFGRNQSYLGELLVQHRIITPQQLKKALDYQKGSDMRLGDVLVQLRYIDEQQKMHFLASQLNVPTALPKQYAGADMNTVALIPETIARRFECIALEQDDTMLTVAMTDVLNLQHLDTLRDLTNLTIRPVLGFPEDIQTTIDRFYRDIASQKDATSLMADIGEDVQFLKQQQEEVNLEEAQAAGAEVGIIKLVNMIIVNAVKERSSDIHIEPMENELVVRYRIDGELRRVLSPPKASHQAIITRIKILSDMNIAERRLPQDGRMVVRMGHREIDIRVSILPTVFGEKGVLRILDKDAFEKSLANLGFSQKDLDVFKKNIQKPYGMIIVTGPTGSGKSTTLYSAIQNIKSVTRNIITVEDPVEFHMEGVNQVNVNTKIGLSFGNALRSILRQDPDIVLIGEIRDNETADIAIKMAMTGHLVFSTLHTNDAASTVARFVDIGIPPLLLGSSLNLIVAQRLVRRVCQKCKTPYSASPELIEQLNLSSDKEYTFYRGEGCVSCNGIGYSGRCGIYELLSISKNIKTLILRNASTLEIQHAAEQEGMQTLRQGGIALAQQGLTTIEQVIAVTTEM